MTKLHLTAGSTAEGPYPLVITPESAGWNYSGLRVLGLPPGGSQELRTGEDEVIVLPLAGSCVVTCEGQRFEGQRFEGQRFELAGRGSVFDGPTDLVYAPRDATVTVSSDKGGRFAFPAARARRRLEPRYVPAGEIPVELRGAGVCSREVRNFGTPEALDADRLIACEVVTPAGNWSSYPPHKHDTDRPGESVLEEIYYYEIAGDNGIAYQRVYGTTDVLAEVRDGDAVLIPHGWHGPSMAVPGYDLYYLNVMAGPGAERAWLICDDPVHAWIRKTWEGRPVDPRLPTGRRQA
ncbi:5-deoxy-glucuronate isomerase [Planosporangium mesophilum]|uniref:5-deoxy-glucuronate isomerase n=1 Tax=Planosporangium mesophilum TaxID=689768 RepID=A0A8J3TBZ9_9ACTN|nr:5-deoxy-glucuronate isomerase [Planosporangium mesophilum]NJC82847.1 5-deoxy-glucuronate isomerase [Planosporangium mesophilum]GII23683.1 5-deoxy-glucuronate isomerase [Planosporangium mesophilum]